MGLAQADILRSHPGFLSRVVHGIPITGDIGRQDEPIHVVSRDSGLALGHRDGLSTSDHIDLHTVTDALAALESPDSQTFVGVDVGRDLRQGQGSHGQYVVPFPSDLAIPLHTRPPAVGSGATG